MRGVWAEMDNPIRGPYNGSAILGSRPGCSRSPHLILDDRTRQMPPDVADFRQPICFLHIDKCAGTTVFTNLGRVVPKLYEIHQAQPSAESPPAHPTFTFIRNPIARFVSAYNFARWIVEFDATGLDPATLTLSNCPAPQRLRRKLLANGPAYEAVYDALILAFADANQLGESLDSSDDTLREKARALMSHPQGPLARGMGWYLRDGSFIERFRDWIFFVGRVERLGDDLRTLRRKLGLSDQEPLKVGHLRENTAGFSPFLSERAVRNVRAWYRDTDYAALRSLLSHGLIDGKTFEAYQTYDFGG